MTIKLRLKAALMASLSAALMCCLLLPVSRAQAGPEVDVPKEPILRIETGMHTAMITRIGIDAGNRYLVTASLDKTVRVWELATGRLIKTLRPPVGSGDEGKIYSVAISPDGKTIACGGWTGYDWDGNVSIYLFDSESGRLIKRIGGLPSVIDHLTYSRDGKYLAAGLWGHNGIRVFNTNNDYTQAGEDKDYGSDSYGLDFDGDGKLATVSLDGYIRLYDKGFKLTAKKKSPGGNRPISVNFSPDGKSIAVGFYDSTKVDVRSGKDLSYLYSPDTTKVDNGNIETVTWSKDGRDLYAGGMYRNNGKSPILKWSNSGKGTYKELPASGDSVMQILPLNDGGIVYGAGDPAFGIINNQDIRTVYSTPHIADYRDFLDGFLISGDGSKVRFAYEEFGKSPAVFDLSGRLLDTNPSDYGSLKPPITSLAGLDVTDWKSTYNPKLNGKALKLKENEISRSLAIAPDGDSLLLGADWDLYLFDKTGVENWEVPAPGVAWSVNITGNGKVAVAAFGDGTIRWYRITDDKKLNEFLAFFPDNDRKRWVLWTPTGYYDASPGGDELIGWHVNNGKDNAADFYPVSKFKSVYYRPDVISMVLKTRDEGLALKEADKVAIREIGKREVENKDRGISIEKMLPPVVDITFPANNASVSDTKVTLKYKLRTPSGEPVTRIRTKIDGRPFAPEDMVVPQLAGDNDEIRITIPERDCEVSVIAENQYSSSVAATIRLIWKNAEKTRQKPIVHNLYILAIGVDHYQDAKLRKLVFARKDAENFVNAFEKQKGVLYNDIIPVLLPETANKDVILAGLKQIKDKTTADDTAIIFMSGHGLNDPFGNYYFMPIDADTKTTERTGVPFTEITTTLSLIKGKVVMFLDTCHAGNVMGSRAMVGTFNNLKSPENGVVVFASSDGAHDSQEKMEWNNGAFTKAVVEGINGKAALKKGNITVSSLNSYVSERVRELTTEQQTPVFAIPGVVTDFPIALRKN
ncbi:MAG: caspase family protein [Nitrospirae bacterium]|nr:caspase family protein [Nitrospirota bacterium]